jgi:predicted metalloendopeptidase
MRFIPALAAASIQAALVTSSWAAGPQAALPPSEPGAVQASACSDFDQYVNGRWVAATELPPSRSRIGSFDSLRMANDKLLEVALAELAADPARQTSPGLKLLAAYYRSGMDEAAIERNGLAPVAPLLGRIAAATSEALPALMAEMARLQIGAPLQLGVGVDAKDATRHVLAVAQDGLGLPDRDDYTKTDASTLRVKAAYRVYAGKLLRAAETQAGRAAADDTALAARVDALLAFEGQLAEASMTRVQRRDPNAVYNPFTVAALQARAPGLDWRALLATYTGRAEGHPVVLGQPDFAVAVARLAQGAELATWRDYLAVRLLDTAAPHLPKVLADASFDYRSGALRGLKAAPPRVESVILAIGGQYGGAPVSQALGELFAAKAFSPRAQQRAQQMLADIKEGMRQRVKASPWMSPPTQVLALQKLDAMVAKIGVPEQWKVFPGLELKPDDYAGNLLRAQAWASAERLPDLDKPVDRARWNTSPHIVNAFAAGGNQIVFPAGILQPPFFSEAADDASNFGGIGMVIGHEITHHFDDRGRQFDAVGNLRDWWQPADAAAYKARADRVAALYSSYEPLPGERINGRLTLGENLSDVGGMQIAFAGLQLALERQRKEGKSVPLIDGQTAEQRFFVSNAIVWRTKARQEALINQLRTDSHSPGRWRILGPMSQMAAFAQAFGCKAGDPMVAGEPIVVW